MHWYIEVLKKYAVFNGRARRKEYWMFYLINSIIVLALSVVGVLVFAGIGERYAGGNASLVLLINYILVYIYSFIVLLPGLGVMVRRLHDTNHSGWWLFIALVPIAGTFILLYFLLKDGDSGENQYGPNPKGISEEEEVETDSENAQTGMYKGVKIQIDYSENAGLKKDSDKY